ncbi:MAG: hypothetical protein J6O73_13785 [Lachnospiraceae bacterium]|nr:hypothetical protein [Lachnospiraceae bacterium]
MELIKKGTIALAKGLVFENGEVDRKPCRPAMIAISADSLTGDLYLLALTSNIHKYEKFQESYYALLEEDWIDAGLKVPSLINLNKVYRVKSVGEVKGGLRPTIYKDVIAKLKKYKERYKDDVYEQIKGKL